MIFKTIDLCAGIGGIRKGFELTGHFQNVLAAEIDRYACMTYKHLFGDDAFHDVTTDDFKNLVVFGNKITPADFKFVRTVPNSSVIIAHINGFEDRTSAEALRGTELFVARDDLPDTKPGEYYQADLIGFTVIQNGEKVGIISGFQNFGAGDIIETSVGNLYSFKGAEVDLNNKTVTVK